MYPFIKRYIDLLGAGVGLIALSPVLIIVAVLVWSKMGRPVLFKQVRPGLKGRLFTMYKFRTMTDERDEAGELLPDEKRLNKLGAFLRSASLDELPELFNVLKGEMSLVGPRPLLISYLERYNAKQARRHEVKPGITGWAQVNGRNALTWDEKFALDVWYVDNGSLYIDAKTLLLTFIKVIKREGINAEGEATMGEFLGNLDYDIALAGLSAEAAISLD